VLPPQTPLPPWPACRVVDYTHFEAGRPDPALFKSPQLCQGLEPQEPMAAGRSGAALRWAALAPSVRYRGDAEVGGSDPGWPRVCPPACVAPPLPARPCGALPLASLPAPPSPPPLLQPAAVRILALPSCPSRPPGEPLSSPRPALGPPALPPLSSMTPSWAAMARRAPTAPWQSTSGGGTCTAPTWRRSRRTTRRRAAPSPWL
jgi:hypothetical protein